MNATRPVRSWRTFLLGAGGVAALLTVILAGRSLAIGGATALSGSGDATEPAAGPNIVLTGNYACSVTTYQVSTLPTEPPAEPQTYVWLSHSIGIEGTGAIATQSPQTDTPPSARPGFAGRAVFGFQPIQPATPGMGISGTFDGGTIEDCRRFAGAVAQAASGLGCTTSTIRQASQPFTVSAQQTVSLSLVCEGPTSTEIHIIGELNRAVARLSVAGSN